MAIAAISAGVTQRIGGFAPTGGMVTDAAIRGAKANVIAQGISVVGVVSRASVGLSGTGTS